MHAWWVRGAFYIRTKLESETMDPSPAADWLRLQQTSLVVGAPSYGSIQSLGWETISTQVSMLGLSMACKGFRKCSDRFLGPVLLVSWLFGKKETTTNPVRVFQRNSTIVPPALWEPSSKEAYGLLDCSWLHYGFLRTIVKINKVWLARILHW